MIGHVTANQQLRNIIDYYQLCANFRLTDPEELYLKLKETWNFMILENLLIKDQIHFIYLNRKQNLNT